MSNEMRKLMEAVQLNEYFVKQGMTFGEAFDSLVGDPEEWAQDVRDLDHDGWNDAAGVARELAREAANAKDTLQSVWDVEITDPELIEELDSIGNRIWDDAVWDENEWLDRRGQGVREALDVLLSEAEALEELGEGLDEDYDSYDDYSVDHLINQIVDAVGDLPEEERATAGGYVLEELANALNIGAVIRYRK